MFFSVFMTLHIRDPRNTNTLQTNANHATLCDTINIILIISSQINKLQKTDGKKYLFIIRVYKKIILRQFLIIHM